MTSAAASCYGINQMRGVYECRHPSLTQLHAEAHCIVQQFRSVQYEHISRAANAVADRLANDGIDDSSMPPPTTPDTAAARRYSRSGPTAAEGAQPL